MVFMAKKPPTDVQRHDKVMEKLDQLAAELAALRAAR